MKYFTYEEKQQLSTILEKLAKAVDLTDAQYELAIARYKSVGEWLSAPGSCLQPFKPIIAPQGSFRIGTVNRPIHEEGEFDVDLICLLQVVLPAIQRQLKQLVGKRLSDNGTYAKMLEEMQRCWRLIYAEAARFHLDIVPAVPDKYDWITAQSVPFEWAQHAVCITDKERADYESYTRDWPKSNPEGYALWFLSIMKVQAEQIRIQLKAQLALNRVDDVPDYKVRTPLQMGVQLMKRHRDIMFGDNKDKPISIIITTLAARAYEQAMRRENTNNFYDILTAMVDSMPGFIENRGGISWVPNPVQPGENFADKWQIKREKRDNFFKWHAAFKASLQMDAFGKGMPVLSKNLQDSFGTRSVNEALNNIGNEAFNLRKTGELKVNAAGLLGAVGTAIKEHSFYGVD